MRVRGGRGWVGAILVVSAMLLGGARLVAAGAPATAVDLGNGAGRPGGVACISGTLTAGGALVSAIQNDIGGDPNQFSFINCGINPAIGAGTTASKQLNASATGPGSERVVLSGSVSNRIPDGGLYTCTVGIAQTAAAGSYALSNTAAATSTSGAAINPVSGAPGQIRVTNCTGDCDGDGTVSIGEVLRCVILFLGQPLCNPAAPSLSCPLADASLDGTVSIGEVQQCVTRFLQGCACPFTFADDTSTLGTACFYSGAFNTNPTCPSLIGSFLSNGAILAVTLNTAPALSFAATVTSATTAALSSYTLGDDPPLSVGGTVELQQGGSVLAVTPQPAPPFDIGGAGCALNQYLGGFTQVVGGTP